MASANSRSFYFLRQSKYPRCFNDCAGVRPLDPTKGATHGQENAEGYSHQAGAEAGACRGEGGVNQNLKAGLETMERRALARSPLCSICGATSRRAGIGDYLSCRNCQRIFLPNESIQAVVAQGDGIFCGIFPGDEKNPTLALFQSRKTGNALAIALLFLTADAVRQALRNSDEKFQNRLRGNKC